MPWAPTAATSFVETPGTYRQLLTAAGFEIEDEDNLREFVLALARELREKAAAGGPPQLGFNALMGPAFRERLVNVMAALERGTIAPVRFIAKAA